MAVPVDCFGFSDGWFHGFAAADLLVLVWWVVSLAAVGLEMLRSAASDLSAAGFKQCQVHRPSAAEPTNVTKTATVHVCKQIGLDMNYADATLVLEKAYWKLDATKTEYAQLANISIKKANEPKEKEVNQDPDVNAMSSLV